MNLSVVVEVQRSARGYAAEWIACSIECARRHGYEPSRMAMACEYDEPCAFCGFDPMEYLPVQDLGKEEL